MGEGRQAGDEHVYRLRCTQHSKCPEASSFTGSIDQEREPGPGEGVWKDGGKTTHFYKGGDM